MTPKDRTAAAEELADVVIYGLSLADVFGVDHSQTVFQKLTKGDAKYLAGQFRGRAR